MTAENTYLIANVAKLKDLCYLNESKQGIDSVNEVDINSSTDKIQYLQLSIKVKQSAKLENPL